ncbi:MAG: MobF family relaxase, partial [Planctomycetota bacterium]
GCGAAIFCVCLCNPSPLSFYMLIATQAKSISGTQKYFEQVLTRGDYYLGQEVAGQWNGKGAEILGLGTSSKVTKEQFNNLLEGKHPETGKNLMQRIRKDRRPGTDLTFSVPKSVSLAWAINQDEKILEALQQSVRETMKRDIEPLMQRRVRTGKHAWTKQKTQTGKLIYADFLHKTSRPVNGKADPHLHVHAFVINWTQQNGKNYAGELEEIVRQRPSLQAKFEARLARKLKHELGYNVEHTRFLQSGRMKSGWEIKGIERPTIEKFSQRTAQVEKHALENNIKDAESKGKLGKITREQKDTGQSIEQLRNEWKSRLTDRERYAFQRLKVRSDGRSGETEQEAALNSVKYALEHHLHRQSTTERHQIAGTALEHGLTLSPEQVEKAIDKSGVIQRYYDADGSKRQLLTTREILNAEKRMIAFARDGRGTRKAIATLEREFDRTWLNDQQKAAVNHVLNSRDTVMAITGGAGTGKSSLMQEAVQSVRENGNQVFTFAPSTGAKEVLEEKGFSNAKTVEHLLRNTKLHPELKDQVLWIDEAGLLDVRYMNGIFDIAKEQNCRVVLSGDTKQHSSPGRGEAMRLIENEAGLKIARIAEIQRQKGRYKEAVEMISRGSDVVDEKTGKTGLVVGFDMLDAMGKIKEISGDDRHEQLATAYLGSIEKKSTLIIAPTHAEAGRVTEEIRDKLREKRKLPNEELQFTRLKSLNLTEAEKSNEKSYKDQDELVVQFHQNTKGGFKKGDRFVVKSINDGEVQIQNLQDNSTRQLPLDACDRFEVYSKESIGVSVGDKIRFSLGGTTKDGSRISNGRLDEVKAFDPNGNIILKNGKLLDRNYGHLDLGYVITSHASQGKDRQMAIAAMGATSLPAINAKQFYVTVSRGSEDVAIFVDDKAKVRRSIERSGQQLSATELVDSKVNSQFAKSAKRENTRSIGEMMRHGQRAFRNFQERLSYWWKGASENSRELAGVGRNSVNVGQGLGLGISQSMERSRI